MADPLVSVCMPTYNGAVFLEEAVRSVLTQTLADFELLIFDDGSTDDTWAFLQTVLDPRVSLHRNPVNLGPEGNWNRSLAAARGKYIKLFHQDDLLAPTCLERQIEALERDPGAVLAFCRRAIIRPDGSRLLTRGAPWPEGPVGTQEAVRRCVLSGANLLGEPSAVLFRTEAARQVGGFDGSIPYLIDLDYWVRLLALGHGRYLDEPLASFRLSPRQWSAAIGKRQGREFVAFIDRLHAHRLFMLKRRARIWGGLMARLNGMMRGWIYRLLLRNR